jgi:hypothetical protein
LEETDIGDTGIEFRANALKTENCKLIELDLERNNIL